MIALSNIGVSVYKGVIPRMYKQTFSLSSICVSIDKGTIPPKNYFKTRIQNVGISVDRSAPSKVTYQLI